MAIIQVQSARDFRHIRAATFGVWLCPAGVFPVQSADRPLCGWCPLYRRRIVFEDSMGVHSRPEHVFEDHKAGTSSSYVSAHLVGTQTNLHSAEAISAYLFLVNILAVCTATVVAAVEMWRLKWAWWSRVSFELGCLLMFVLFELGESYRCYSRGPFLMCVCSWCHYIDHH